MAVAFVKYSASTVVDGKPVRLHKDEAWDADDPVVKARPDLFNDAPEVLRTSGESASTPQVEEATAEPGRKRAAKKAASKS
jgi:hypothetical protein